MYLFNACISNAWLYDCYDVYNDDVLAFTRWEKQHWLKKCRIKPSRWESYKSLVCSIKLEEIKYDGLSPNTTKSNWKFSVTTITYIFADFYFIYLL